MPNTPTMPEVETAEDAAQKRKLLTPELKARVELKVRHYLDLATALWPDHAAKFNDAPKIRWDIKNRFGGTAQSGGPDDWTIRLNLILCYENMDQFIDSPKSTVAHEVAHLVQHVVFGFTKQVEDKATGKKVTKKVRAHGPEWREVMVKLGQEPNRCHTWDTSSIEVKKRKRAKPGSLLDLLKVVDMRRRLMTGVKRLDSDSLREFIRECEQILEDRENPDVD